MSELIKAGFVDGRIYVIRGKRVIMDQDLAALYGVATKVLNQAVKRHSSRFPEDFMLRLTPREQSILLRCRLGAAQSGRGGRRYLALAFTEQGVAMLSGILTSPRAVQVNIAIMRAFVRMREVLAGHKALARRLEAAERRLAFHDAALGEHAEEIRAVFAALRRLMTPPLKPRPAIGFKPPEGGNPGAPSS
ncbi:MAG TPA: DNA-binding protein [Elusimicrobia bacterium]|nr:DNA-binding protein [Elusimicrobiota bacterium]HBT62749.1 DNA-binding protein [Elusimicrobiota bacterium]